MPRRDSPCSEDAFVAQHPPDHPSSFNVMLLYMAKIPRELIPRIQGVDCRGQNMMERCTLIIGWSWGPAGERSGSGTAMNLLVKIGRTCQQV
jgi:hypothetical protein